MQAISTIESYLCPMQQSNPYQAVRRALRRVKLWQWLAAAVMAACTWGLGYGVAQSDFGRILAFYALFFLVYAGVATLGHRERVGFWLVVAVVLRLLLLPAVPALSDDVWRFLWDGRLLAQGISPFAHLPAWYLEPGHELPGLTAELYGRLNSPAWFTIYPPVAQWVFALSAWLSPNDALGSIVVLRLFLLACELGTLWLLYALCRHFGLAPRQVLWYALNPLVIVEITGNLHFEGAMICFALLSLWLAVQQRLWASAAAMSLSVASKLLPLMWWPFFIRRWGWRRAPAWFAVSILLIALLFAPLVWGPLWAHFGESLDLYFRKFEFNAGIYYLVRWLRYLQLGYNDIARIGPALALAAGIGILLMAWRDRRTDWASLPQSMMWALTWYLLLATTVHPWYLTTLVALAALTPWRFPIAWSALAVLSYHAYAATPVQEKMWVVALEYALVSGWLLWEWRTRRRTA